MNSSQIIAESVFQPSQFANLGNSTGQLTATVAIPKIGASTTVSKKAASFPWGKVFFWAAVFLVALYGASAIWEHHQRKQNQKAMD
jgi:hypothetical protein